MSPTTSRARDWRWRRVGVHFRAGEFFPPDHDRRPPERGFTGLQRLCLTALDPMRSRFGVCTVNSGYRSAQRNQQVGGAPRSFHRYELREWRVPAADVRFARGTPLDWARHAVSLGVGGVIRYPTHVHVDLRPITFHSL